jgi:hypothetical protein
MDGECVMFEKDLRHVLPIVESLINKTETHLNTKITIANANRNENKGNINSCSLYMQMNIANFNYGLRDLENKNRRPDRVSREKI